LCPRDRQSAAFDFIERRVLAALDRSLDRAAVVDERQEKAESRSGAVVAVKNADAARKRAAPGPITSGCRISSGTNA
jgi:hypothetical protein